MSIGRFLNYLIDGVVRELDLPSLDRGAAPRDRDRGESAPFEGGTEEDSSAWLTGSSAWLTGQGGRTASPFGKETQKEYCSRKGISPLRREAYNKRLRERNWRSR